MEFFRLRARRVTHCFVKGRVGAAELSHRRTGGGAAGRNACKLNHALRLVDVALMNVAARMPDMAAVFANRRTPANV